MSQDGSERGTPRPEGASSPQKEAKRPAASVTTASVLESFFPFDPYKLESSASFIEPLYREWADVAPDEDGADSSEEEDDDEADDVRRNERGGGVEIPGSRARAGNDEEDDDANSSSFVSQVEAMSISPYLAS
jgi:RNA polymerase I-specific transcription initiation factor RRN3